MVWPHASLWCRSWADWPLTVEACQDYHIIHINQPTCFPYKPTCSRYIHHIIISYLWKNNSRQRCFLIVPIFHFYISEFYQSTIPKRIRYIIPISRVEYLYANHIKILPITTLSQAMSTNLDSFVPFQYFFFAFWCCFYPLLDFLSFNWITTLMASKVTKILNKPRNSAVFR